MKVIPLSFFDRKAATAARELLGMYLARRLGKKTVRMMITEVEVYEGFDDKASHAARGKTARNAPMWGAAGRFYVYLCYGMYEMLNVVVGHEGFPAALLIRGAGEWNGPGKLTRELGITRSENGKPAVPATGLWFEYGEKIPPSRIERLPRVGVQYSGEWRDKKLRYRLRK